MAQIVLVLDKRMGAPLAFSKFSTAFDGRNRAAVPVTWTHEYHARAGHHYDPNQPRVPRGHPDGGQWTHTGTSEMRGSLGEAGRRVADAPSEFERPWPTTFLAALLQGQIKLAANNWGTLITSWKAGNLEVMAVYGFGSISVVTNVDNALLRKALGSAVRLSRAAQS